MLSSFLSGALLCSLNQPRCCRERTPASPPVAQGILSAQAWGQHIDQKSAACSLHVCLRALESAEFWSSHCVPAFQGPGPGRLPPQTAWLQPSCLWLLPVGSCLHLLGPLLPTTRSCGLGAETTDIYHLTVWRLEVQDRSAGRGGSF